MIILGGLKKIPLPLFLDKNFSAYSAVVTQQDDEEDPKRQAQALRKKYTFLERLIAV